MMAAECIVSGMDYDMTQILSTLQQGTVLLRFYRRPKRRWQRGRQPNEYLYRLNLDTLEILQLELVPMGIPRDTDESSEYKV